MDLCLRLHRCDYPGLWKSHGPDGNSGESKVAKPILPFSEREDSSPNLSPSHRGTAGVCGPRNPSLEAEPSKLAKKRSCATKCAVAWEGWRAQPDACFIPPKGCSVTEPVKSGMFQTLKRRAEAMLVLTVHAT